MKNILIDKLNEKDIDHFTTDTGLNVRNKIHKPFIKACNVFTNANIIRMPEVDMSDDEYFNNLKSEYIPKSNYPFKEGKNNIVLERYPKLDENESYIFVCNHTCPEDIETVLNIIDRNAYLILGSIETLKYNPEMYLSWLNGMIVFDILDEQQRKDLMPKMERVLKTNSILIFPEGSHNYSPNKIVNNLYDGVINLALSTGKKIVVVSMLREEENKTSYSYIDVCNPITIEKPEVITKEYIKMNTSNLRDKMATSVYHMIERHFEELKREDYGDDIEDKIRREKVIDAFKKLKWTKDVFKAEYLVKQTQAEKEHYQVAQAINNNIYNLEALNNINVEEAMRKYLKETQEDNNIKKK